MSSVLRTSPSFLSCLWISSAVMGKGRPQEALALRSALMQASRADRNCPGKDERERISVRLMAYSLYLRPCRSQCHKLVQPILGSGHPYGWLRLRIFFQNARRSKRKDVCAATRGFRQREADLVPTLLATWKAAVRDQRGLVHQPVGIVFYSVNPAPGNDLPRSVAFRHSGPRPCDVRPDTRRAELEMPSNLAMVG
jgi:hypothetical protein